MLTPAMHRRNCHGLAYAVDTGCYKNPDGFDLAGYLARLEDWRELNDKPLFATAPDVVGDPAETWRRSEQVLPVLREHGHSAALVAQDGLTDPDWDTFDCLFVGGTTAWKLSESAYRLAAEAKTRGKWIHMGRVNSANRFLAAAGAGYDSADGTFVGWGPDIRLPEVASWLRQAGQQISLWDMEGTSC